MLQHAVASLATALAVLGLCGGPTGLPIAVSASVGTLVWLTLATRYRLRLRREGDRRSSFRRTEDRVMARCGVIGLVVPGALGWIAWALDAPDPVLDGGAAAVGGSLAVAIPITIVASGTIDWYLILPFVRGVFGPPTCRRDEHDVATLRAYVKYWIAHRWGAELICYVSLAMVVAIGLNSLGGTAAGDVALAGAVASLSAGGILAYVAPRLRQGWQYFFAQNVGLGTWARGRDSGCGWVEGMVVDVSLHPGVKLLENPDARECFVPLSNTDTLTELPSRPAACFGEGCGGWLARCEIAERERDERPPRA